MPIASFQLPNGKIADFQVPDGTTAEQAQAMLAPALAQISAGMQAQQNTEPQAATAEGRGWQQMKNAASEYANNASSSNLEQQDKAGSIPSGLVETGMNMGSGIAASIPAGLAGLYGLVKGESPDEANKRVAAIQQALTYRPRTSAGKLGVATAGTAMGALTDAVGGGASVAAHNFLGVDDPNTLDAIHTTAGTLPLVVPLVRGGFSAAAALKGGAPAAAVPMSPYEAAIREEIAAKNAPAAHVEPTAEPQVAPVEVPSIPEAIPRPMSALEQYMANKAVKSPYGELPPNESPTLPNTEVNPAESPLDAYVREQANRSAAVDELPQSVRDYINSKLPESEKAPIENFNHDDATPFTEQENVPSSEVQNLDPVNDRNADQTAADRYAEAQSLRVPMNITKGMATRDPELYSWEQNNRAAVPELSQRMNDLNNNFTQNMLASKEALAPDVSPSDTMLDHGQGMWEQVKGKVNADDDAIKNAYQELAAKNGGNMPLDGEYLGKTIQDNLSSSPDQFFVPDNIKKMVDFYTQPGQLTFDAFEALRSKLAQAQRSAPDGLVRHAIGNIRNTVESLPMTDETAALKPLADNARALYRAQAEIMNPKKAAYDPVYKAVANDPTPIDGQSPLADNFYKTSILNNKSANIAKLMEKVGDDPIFKQHLAAATIDHLSDAARIDLRTKLGTANQNGYNNALEKLTENHKLEQILPEESQQLKNLGNTMYNIHVDPPGAFVNHSNTLTGALANNATYLAEHAINSKTLILGTVLKKLFTDRALKNKTQASLMPDVNSLQDMSTPQSKAALQLAQMKANAAASRAPSLSAPIDVPEMQKSTIAAIMSAGSVDEAIDRSRKALFGK